MLRAFADGFAEASVREPTVPRELGAALVDAFARGREAWPAVTLAGPAFAHHLGRVVANDAAAAAAEPGTPPPVIVLAASALASLHVADLFLACACAHGN